MWMLSLIAALAFVAQEQTGPTAAELTAMKKLSFLAGKWEGEGWMRMGPGEPLKFTGTETVQVKLQGKALLVEGLFRGVSDKKVIHETLAVITYDEGQKKYRFNTYLFNRPNGEFELELLDQGFRWSLQPAGGPKAQYTMKLTPEGSWHEIGEVDIPGQGKFQFLEMRLKKK